MDYSRAVVKLFLLFNVTTIYRRPIFFITFALLPPNDKCHALRFNISRNFLPHFLAPVSEWLLLPARRAAHRRGSSAGVAFSYFSLSSDFNGRHYEKYLEENVFK